MRTRVSAPFRPRSPASTRRLAWLLALALLLPFAQSLAWAHQLTHHGTQRADAGAVGQLDSPCAICLSAAPLHSGALPAAAPIVVEPTLAHVAPPTAARAWQRHAECLAYLSRAPPHA